MKLFFYKYVLGKPLWVNILYGIGLIIFVLIIFVISLNAITRFNKILKVPNIVGLPINIAIKNLENTGFNVEIQDSIFVDSISKIAIVRQNPDPDEIVKYGRTIYLTINRIKPPQVEMPNLIGFSLESALQFLKSIGLKINQIIYKNDEAYNIILSTLCNGENIESGSKLNAGIGIDLVVGNGNSIIEMDVPNLLGLTVEAAKERLKSMNLKLGNIILNSTIIDTNLSYIINQTPTAISNIMDSTGLYPTNKIKSWQSIDVAIAVDPLFIDSTKN